MNRKWYSPNVTQKLIFFIDMSFNEQNIVFKVKTMIWERDNIVDLTEIGAFKHNKC